MRGSTGNWLVDLLWCEGAVTVIYAMLWGLGVAEILGPLEAMQASFLPAPSTTTLFHRPLRHTPQLPHRLLCGTETIVRLHPGIPRPFHRCSARGSTFGWAWAYFPTPQLCTVTNRLGNGPACRVPGRVRMLCSCGATNYLG